MRWLLLIVLMLVLTAIYLVAVQHVMRRQAEQRSTINGAVMP